MGRKAGNRRQPDIKPVEKIEISEKHIGRRAVAATVFLLIGAGALAYFFINLVRGDTGWTQITVSSSELNCGEDFTFLYETGSGAWGEKRAVTKAYTQAAEEAYQIFENGVRSVNAHPNETVIVDAALYKAFEKLEKANGRWLYLPAVYEVYDNLFASVSDLAEAEFDPWVNEDVEAYFEEVLSYANDPEAVDLELIGDNRVRLLVSEEYMEFAEENETAGFIGFYWMKNAFVADYLADCLAAAGFTHGCLSSCDGFVRNLDERGQDYFFNVYDSEADNQVVVLAKMRYHGPLSLVRLYDYAINDEDLRYRYRMADGAMRTAYIDWRDGFCRSSISSIVSYSYDKETGCADVLLSVLPVYIADKFDEDALNALSVQTKGAVYSVFRQDDEIRANDLLVEFEDIYKGYVLSR